MVPVGKQQEILRFRRQLQKICEETAGRLFTALSSTKSEQVEALVSHPEG
jgi:hypothetical protein